MFFVMLRENGRSLTPVSQFVVALLLCYLHSGGADKNPETLHVRAGEAVSVPCPGVSDGDTPGGYIINHLVWSCFTRQTCVAANSKGQLVEYAGGQITVKGDQHRLGLSVDSWALQIAPAQTGDTATYRCSFNNQNTQPRLIRLEVLDVPSPPGRPMVVRHESRQLDLSWAPSFYTHHSDIQFYVIQTRYGDEGPWPSLEAGQRTDGRHTNATVSGLWPFTVYTFRVVASNAQGYSQPSEACYPVQTLRERPGAAPNITYARSRSPTSIEMGWVPPSNQTIHGEFTGYWLTYLQAEPAQKPGPTRELLLRDYVLRSHLLTNLRPFTRYKITLQIKNPEDLGPAATIYAVTAEGVPSRPKNLTVAEVADRSLTLTWSPPARPNGELTGYSVYVTRQGRIVQRRNASQSVNSLTLSKLEPDTEYSVWVKALTAAGEGDRSFPVLKRTDVSGPGAPVITNISCPTASSLVLQWRRPDVYYRSVDMYYLLYRYQEDEFQERMVPARHDQLQFSIVLRNLTTDKLYELRVQGATRSPGPENRIYKGQQSSPARVRMERGCAQLELIQTVRHRTAPVLAGAQLAGVLLGAVAVLFLTAAVVFWRRGHKLPTIGAGKPAAAVAVHQQGGWPAPAYEAVPSHLFQHHVRQLRAEAGAEMRREWEALQQPERPAAGDSHSADAATAQARDPARVAVTGRLYRRRAVPAAFWVDGFRRPRAFIVTDRPSPAAHDALLRLAWEQNVAAMVLIGSLEALVEHCIPKVGERRPLGDLQLKVNEEHSLAESIIRDVTIAKLKSRGKRAAERRLRVLQYIGWPGLGVPRCPLTLLQFVRRALATAEMTPTAPLLVVSGTSHCSAGIFISMVTLLTQLSCSNELGIHSYWKHIGRQCPFPMTSVEEYAFLHDCLLERVMAGETLVPRDRTHAYIEQLQGTTRASFPFPAAEKQYKSAIALESHQFTVVSAARPCNESKNRSLGCIPMEASRVLLSAGPGLEGADYVNATWLPGLRRAREFILTQHPLPNTVVDFWQLVWESRSATVACLSPESCGVFWPLEGERIQGPGFSVRYVSESAECSATYKSSWIVRSFLVESSEHLDSITVRLMHLPLWPEECSTDSAMEAVLGVRLLHADRDSPLVVVDRYGGTEGASFCLLNTVSQQLELESTFDVYTYAKMYHQRRPGIWKSMREYLYLYYAIEGWLATTRGDSWYRPNSCTSLCERRTSTEVQLIGSSDGVKV